MRLTYAQDDATLREVYNLLQRCAFPWLPNDWETAYGALQKCQNYIGRQDGKVVLWVCYHTFSDTQCDLDICVVPELKRKWLTKGLFRDIVSKPLLNYGLKLVSCKCYDDAFYRSLLRLGFSEGYSGPSECVFTHKEFKQKFGHMNG